MIKFKEEDATDRQIMTFMKTIKRFVSILCSLKVPLRLSLKYQPITRMVIFMKFMRPIALKCINYFGIKAPETLAKMRIIIS